MFTPAENLSPNAIGTEAVIVAPPDSKNAEEWEAGRFVVREKDSKKETTCGYLSTDSRDQCGF